MTRTPRTSARLLVLLLDRILVVAGALVMTLGLFLVLPLIQTLTAPAQTDLIVQTIDTAQIEPPPPPPEEEIEEQPEPEEQPPELTEAAPPLDLSQLELALNPGTGGGIGGDFAVNLTSLASTAKTTDVDSLFSIADLDQKPRVIYQPAPRITPDMRGKGGATVYIIFIVDQSGRVTDPIVQKSTDPIFEKSALDAVKQWKFEPGKRNGEAVRFRMRVPITFPEGL